jgi:hypothetical protein
MARESRVRIAIVTAALVACPLALPASRTILPQATATAAPAGQQIRFAYEIKQMLNGDRIAPPPQNAILFIGSSIFRLWPNVKEQMAPLPVFNRAFGGSRTWEVLHYMNEIVLPYRPRIIVYYTGSNDVNAGQPAQAIVGRTMEFMTRTHAALPATRIYYVAINRSPDKRDKWDVVDAVNAQMKTAASSSSYLRHIDLNPVLFRDGEPRTELYLPDGLHFHPPAYDEFTAIVKPVLTQAWREVGK